MVGGLHFVWKAGYQCADLIDFISFFYFALFAVFAGMRTVRTFVWVGRSGYNRFGPRNSWWLIGGSVGSLVTPRSGRRIPGNYKGQQPPRDVIK